MGKANKGIARKDKGSDVDKKIVMVDHDKCKPKSPAFKYLQKHAGGCGKECISVQGKHIVISEEACAACILRASKCPTPGAVKVVKVPAGLTADTTHQYGQNMFKLHGLPQPRPGHVLGLLGQNGIGKSSALKVLSMKLKPNLGDFADGVKWEDIVGYYRGSDLQNYFIKLLEQTTSVALKPQMDTYVANASTKRTVKDVYEKNNERSKDVGDWVMEQLELTHLMDREVSALSGGEMQRLAIMAVVLRDVDVYIFDEPTSFLDVKQRITASRVIRSILESSHWEGDDSVASSKYIIVVEHDLAVLDYISDYICCMFGEPGAYGVVTARMTVFNGINQYLAGYFEAENMRFRAEELDFKVSVDEDESFEVAKGAPGVFEYPGMSKTLQGENSSFTLHVEPGNFKQREIVGLLGENGCGKTTFMQLLAGAYDTDENGEPLKKGAAAVSSKETVNKAPSSLRDMGVSFKRQHNTQRYRRFPGTVQDLLERTIQQGLADRFFRLLVMKPLRIEEMKDLPVASLSGGEMQRVAITICLGQPARVYLLDEPSAGLDCEQRVIVAKVIKRWIVTHRMQTGFIIEHDFLMASTMFDRVVVYTGTPGHECTAGAPSAIIAGMNSFLEQLDVTFRRDPGNARPRINKHMSTKDREQKAAGCYYLADEPAMMKKTTKNKKEGAADDPVAQEPEEEVSVEEANEKFKKRMSKKGGDDDY